MNRNALEMYLEDALVMELSPMDKTLFREAI